MTTPVLSVYCLDKVPGWFPDVRGAVERAESRDFAINRDRNADQEDVACTREGRARSYKRASNKRF